MCTVVSFNEVHQISSRCVFTDNGQVIWGEKNFLKLDDVGVHAAEALVQNFPPCCLDTADTAYI